MKLIEKFLRQYSREVDLYRQASRLAEERCEALLEENGIRAIVTSRAKRMDRCAEKAKARNKRRKKKYKTVRGIFKDIVDLAGVRIALYFPETRTKSNGLSNVVSMLTKVKHFRKKRGAEREHQSHFMKRNSVAMVRGTML